MIMDRKEIKMWIFKHHHEVGLFFSSNYKCLSPAYGIDNPVMEFRGCTANLDEIISLLENEMEITPEKLISAFKVAVHNSYVLKQNRAHWENACDYLYYGYGYKQWKPKDLSEEDARIIWNAAFNYMAQS